MKTRRYKLSNSAAEESYKSFFVSRMMGLREKVRGGKLGKHVFRFADLFGLREYRKGGSETNGMILSAYVRKWYWCEEIRVQMNWFSVMWGVMGFTTCINQQFCDILTTYVMGIDSVYLDYTAFIQGQRSQWRLMVMILSRYLSNSFHIGN